MIANLFSIFDPSTPNLLSTNWLSAGLFLALTPAVIWTGPARPTRLYLSLTRYIYAELRPLIKKTPYMLVIAVSFFTIIIFNNVLGLLPYIFTASRHLVFTLSLAVPAWLALMLFGWLNNSSNLLAHLTPQGTPVPLIPFIVLIETIRNLIRPGTLAVRLSANIIAGHLLIVLLSSASPLTPLLLRPLILGAQIALGLLELAVAFIQAYVFRVLITLYAAETVS